MARPTIKGIHKYDYLRYTRSYTVVYVYVVLLTFLLSWKKNKGVGSTGNEPSVSMRISNDFRITSHLKIAL